MSSDPPPRKEFRRAFGELTHRATESLRLPRPLHPPTSSAGPASLPAANSSNMTQTSESGNALHRAKLPLALMQGAGRATWAGLKTALQTLQHSSDMFPPVKPAVDGLFACIDILEAAADTREEYRELASNLTVIVGDLARHLRESRSTPMSHCVSSIISGIEEQMDCIKLKSTRLGPRRCFEAEEDIEDIIRCYRRVEMLFRQLHELRIPKSNAALSVWSIVNEQLVNTRLESMRPARDAHYDSAMAAVVRRRQCTPNTRKAILEDLLDWARNPDGAKVYWMNGMAGTGKTTIAYTLCAELEATHQLAASFFCSRELSDCRDAARIIPTIAYQLARFSHPFQSAVCRVLGDDPDASTRSIGAQFEKLIRNPVLQVNETLPAGTVVVVVDAIDECFDNATVQPFLDALLHSAATLPIKFFVACRPEPHLYDTLLSLHEKSRHVLHLHDIEQSVVQGDIETYLKTELPRIPADRVRRLAELSGKLFIFAATVVRYVKPSTAGAIRHERLNTILTAVWSRGTKAYTSIDALYRTILSSALSDDELEPAEVETVRRVLITVICVKEPMTISAMTCLLDIASDGVELAMERLRSVLHVAEGTSLVSTLHASFSDYMLNQERSGHFFCDPSVHHHLLALRCLDVMKLSLRFNICNLESSYQSDVDVLDLPERINHAISSHLFYACRHWANHLCEAGPGGELMASLDAFLSSGVLFWLEVLNLKKCTYIGVIMLAQAYNWLQGRNAPSSVCRIAQDAHKFATVLAANAVRKSTPHMYVSVLALWSREDPMWTNYGARTQGLVQLEKTLHGNQTSAALAIWNAGNTVWSIAVSSDGSRVVSGCGSGVIIWDAYTGNKALSLLEGHKDLVTSVAISPDGHSVASGSYDRTIYIWNAHNGDILSGPLMGHADRVRSVVFSPNGARIASGSSDCSIRIWDTQTGNALLGPLKGHTHHVLSVAFSPDGGRVISGSADCTIRIWDAQTGHMLIGPLEGHTDWIRSVAFSPDGARFASGSEDRTIRVWEASSGNMLAGPFNGHTNAVTSVMFSFDGASIVSGSFDCGIYIWDVQSGNVHAGPLQGHSAAVWSVAFSPGSNQIVSGSDDWTLRIWSVHARNPLACSLEVHADSVLSVAFSPNSSRIVSGFEHGTICIWSVYTGDLLAGPIKGHTGGASSVLFSPDGGRIASGSTDRTIRIWDAQTGDMLLGPLRGHTNNVSSVAFSPNGKRIMSGSCDSFSPDGTRITSGSQDRTVRIWDAQTGDMLVGPLKGHLKSVSSVAFSPDGGHVVSGSGDCTICVWDAQTGHMLVGPLRGHTGHVNSIAFSPTGSRIVSGSHDCTIRIWDAQTGRILAGPFEAHTRAVNSVAFSPDGGSIASGSHDGSIFIWKQHDSDYDNSNVAGWVARNDGWILGQNSAPLLWLSPALRAGLEVSKPIVIHDRWPFGINFDIAPVGTRWATCFLDGVHLSQL